MKRYVYMNHRLHEAEPSGPVIVAQDAAGQKVEANEFELRFDGFKIGRVVFNPKGLAACKTHDVKAWLELEEGVELVPDGKTNPDAVRKLSDAETAKVLNSPARPFSEDPLGLKRQPASAKLPNKKIKLH